MLPSCRVSSSRLQSQSSPDLYVSHVRRSPSCRRPMFSNPLPWRQNQALHLYMSRLCRIWVLHWASLWRRFLWNNLWLSPNNLINMTCPMMSELCCHFIGRHALCPAIYSLLGLLLALSDLCDGFMAVKRSLNYLLQFNAYDMCQYYYVMMCLPSYLTLFYNE